MQDRAISRDKCLIPRGLGWLRGRDLNPRPSGYEPDELPGCSTPRFFKETRNAISSTPTQPFFGEILATRRRRTKFESSKQSHDGLLKPRSRRRGFLSLTSHQATQPRVFRRDTGQRLEAAIPNHIVSDSKTGIAAWKCKGD